MPTARPTLIFYLFPPCSTALVSAAHALADPERRSAFLWAFFEPYVSLLPGFDPARPECVPSAILATEWCADELAGHASYVNFQVGVANAAGDVEALRAGCAGAGPDGPRVWFCGEHVAPFEECGTATGAYMSGEEAARRVMSAFC